MCPDTIITYEARLHLEQQVEEGPEEFPQLHLVLTLAFMGQ